MTEDEARDLLPLYVDGLLKPDQAREIEAAIATAPKLQSEYKRLKEENAEVNALLNEALAPLRPSRSARMRLTDAMVDVHRRVEHVANTMPERGWRIFRYVFGLFSLLSALIVVYRFPRTGVVRDDSIPHYITLGVFMIGIIFLMCGRMLAELEARLIGKISSRDIEPTRLEILTLEVFGILSILASGALYIFQG